MTDRDKVSTGRILKVSRQGWGFISCREIEFTRIFFHWTALRQDSIPFLELRIGMEVEFIPFQIPGKGWRAVRVRAIKREKTNETIDTVPTLQE
jgi:cold shock CspA family protein